MGATTPVSPRRSGPRGRFCVSDRDKFVTCFLGGLSAAVEFGHRHRRTVERFGEMRPDGIKQPASRGSEVGESFVSRFTRSPIATFG